MTGTSDPVVSYDNGSVRVEGRPIEEPERFVTLSLHGENQVDLTIRQAYLVALSLLEAANLPGHADAIRQSDDAESIAGARRG